MRCAATSTASATRPRTRRGTGNAAVPRRRPYGDLSDRRGPADVHGPLNILHFDAHPDLYDDFEGDPLSHASPFARIMECGGCEAAGPGRHPHAQRALPGAGARASASRRSRCAISRRTVVPIPDGAALHQHRHGCVRSGLRARRLAPRARRAFGARYVVGAAPDPGPIVGADIVEYNPARDVNGMTAVVAAKLVKEIAALAAGG